MSTQPDFYLNGFLDDLKTSYENRIQKIQTAFHASDTITESSQFLFNNVQNSLNELKKEREILNSRLSEILAKNGSLRKKDYNLIMTDVLSILDEKEKETESQFLNFIKAQKEITQSLKNSLLSIKDIASHDSNEKINIIKEQLSQVSKLQGLRKETVIKAFTDFQDTHNRIMKYLEDLLQKGDRILIKDIKSIKEKMLNEAN